MEQNSFSFCIGKPWHPEDPHSAICTYAYGREVFHGDLEYAEEVRKFITQRANDGDEYSIYKLVKVEADGTAG